MDNAPHPRESGMITNISLAVDRGLVQSGQQILCSAPMRFFREQATGEWLVAEIGNHKKGKTLNLAISRPIRKIVVRSTYLSGPDI